MADDFDPDAFLAQIEPTEARLMSYGPIEGEFHNAAMFGPQGNALQPYDVAASPDMGLDQGEWIRVNGGLHRVGDASYFSPGNPTSQTIELRDQRDQGTGAVARAEPFDPDAFLNRVKPFDPDEFLKTVVAPSPTPATDAAQNFSPLPRGPDTGIAPTPPPVASALPVIPPSLNPLRPEAPPAPPPSPAQPPSSAPPVPSPPPAPEDFGIPNITELRKGRIKTAQQLVADQPEWMQNAVEAAAEVGSEQIPKSWPELGEFLRVSSTPVAGASDELTKSVGLVRDLIGGKTLPEAEKANFPESQMIAEAEQTPPFSKERFKAGFQVMTQLGMATVIAAQLKGGGRDAIKEGKIEEGVRAKPEDRITGGQAQEAGVSDRVQPAAEVRPQEVAQHLAKEGADMGLLPAGEGVGGSMFNDPVTKSSIFVPETGTAADLAQKLTDTRAKFGAEPPKVSKPTEQLATGTPSEPGIAAPAVEPTVPEQFKTKSEVRNLIEQQKVEPEAPALKIAEARPEGGALLGAGGKRPPPVKAIGKTPAGDTNFLRIASPVKRLGRGLLTEGTRQVLGRSKNKVGKMLGKATRQHVDIEQELFGQHEKIMRDALVGLSKERREGAFAEVSRYIQDVENKRPSAPLLPDAQKILDAWYDIGKSTGDIARANGVQVQEADGTYRPMGTVQNYIPRMFKSEVEAVLRDPDSNPTLFNKLADDLAKHRGVTPEEAATELREGTAARFSGNDFMSNLELARKEPLPESFYEYDLRNLASRYLPSFSERMAQIISYGQRLGRREAPIQQNLWDVARKETGGHTDTQEWLNAAEDQATNVKPRQWGIRAARRGQALGNAFLLSDPTTTVARNLISGLGVTTERYGIGRSLRGLVSSGKTASRLGAREIGVLRDDIGSFLGAEQLGNAKLDNFIRGLQQHALTISGFSGSETLVRSHGALVSSTFARDAAAALAKNPASRLSKEALAYFKRLDVDPEKIVAEKGDWKTGAETRKFIRTSVRESQGGYRFDQVPVWAGTTAGRFLYQYGRWAIQRAGDIIRNTVRPAIGEQVEFRGQKMVHRNVLPLMRLGLITAGLGETFAAIASTLFDKDRKDATFKEIGEAMNESELKAVGLLGERIVNDMITAGTLGLLGQPLDFIKATKDQTRFKNPANPPSLFGITALISLAQKAWDQGGSLTKRDWIDAATSTVRGPKNVMDVLASKTGEQIYQSQNDQRTLRNAARRWAKDQDMDVAPPSPAYGDFRKSPNAPVFEKVNDALMAGDANKARQVADDYINNAKDPVKAAKAVHSSVVGKHPFRAGQFTSDKHQKAFLAWAKTHLPEQDVEQVNRVINLYEKTARNAGLMK